jgi:hypothetical protein
LSFKRILLLIVLVPLAILFLIFYIKIGLIVLDAGVNVSDFAIGLFNFFLNMISILIGVLGPIIFGLLLLGVTLVLIVYFFDKLSELNSFLQLKTNNKPYIIIPVLLAGIVQVLLLLLSHNLASSKMKFLLSVYLWSFVTICMILYSSNKPTKYKTNIIFSAIITICIIGLSIVKFQLYSGYAFVRLTTKIQAAFINTTIFDFLSIILIFSLSIGILSSLIYFKKKSVLSNNTTEAPPKVKQNYRFEEIGKP